MASTGIVRIALACVIFILALGVRLFDLGGAPLWGDEIFSWMVAHLRPSYLIGYLYQGNNPPLWELILSLWLKWRPEGEAASLRLLPALFSALTALVLFELGRRWGGLPAGFTSALLWIFSTFGQSICREARAYALLSLLSAGNLYAFWRYYQGQKGFWLWGILSILLLHTHYTGAFLLTAEGLWLLLRWRASALAVVGKYSLALLFGTGLGLLVWLDRALLYEKTGYGPLFSHESIYNLLWAFSNQPVPTVIALCILALAMAHVYLKRPGTPQAQNAKEAFLFFLVLIGLLIGIGFRQPLWQARYFVPLAITYLWVLGLAVAASPRRFQLLGASLLTISWVVSFRLRPPSMSPELPEIANLAIQKPKNKLLLISPDYLAPALAYFLKKEDPTLLCRDCADITAHAAQKLALRYHIYGISYYASLPVCEMLAQDTLWWLDSHLCSAHPTSLLEELLLQDYRPISIKRFAKGTTFLILTRHKQNLPTK